MENSSEENSRKATAKSRPDPIPPGADGHGPPERDVLNTAAYGGPGWSPRVRPLRDELGDLWRSCGINTEWGPLRAVLLHRPGLEIEQIDDPNAMQMLGQMDCTVARAQLDGLAETYRSEGVDVYFVEPPITPDPNLMYVADLLFMTPEGAIVGRPASTVRAGEEVWVARRLADLAIPILSTIHGTGTFEGADAMWLNSRTVLLGVGVRTNLEGAEQVTRVLNGFGVEVVQVPLPWQGMHLMGALRIPDLDLAVVWPERLPDCAIEALETGGFRVLLIPDRDEAVRGMALNFVVLGPRRIVMPSGNPRTQKFYEKAGLTCLSVDVRELALGAGGIGCMTGVLERR